MALVSGAKKGTGLPIIGIHCTCGTNSARMKVRYAYIMEERHSAYHGGQFGGGFSHVNSIYSTIVCMVPGCLGRRRVMWDPIARGLKGLLWQEYVEKKRAEGCHEIPLGNSWSVVVKNASPEWVEAHRTTSRHVPKQQPS